MDQIKTTSIFSRLLWGLVLGAAFIFSENLFQLGLEGLSVYLMKLGLSGLLLIVTLLWAKHWDQGNLTYKRAKNFSFSIAFLGALLLGAYTFIHFKYINASYMAENIQMNIEQMRAENWTEGEIEDKVKEMRFWISPLWYAISKFVFHLFLGLLLAFCFSWVIGNKRSGQQV